MRNIDKWACVCTCSVVGLAAAVGPAEPGSIKHDSPHEINYSWRGFWGALSGGPVCVCVRVSYQCAYMCVGSHSSLLIVLARAAYEVAPRRLVQWLRVGALYFCELTQTMSFNL